MATRYGGPEVLEVGEVPDPKIEPDQLLVRVEYAGLNFSDVDHRRGERGTPLPMILGTEGCGTVVEVGGEAPGFTVGDPVGLVVARAAEQLQRAGGDSGPACGSDPRRRTA